MFKKLLIVTNTILLLGCNTILLGSYGEQNQSLKDFAESVFIFQNRMTNAVMFSETELSVAILDAEQKMRIACEPLNTAGVLQFYGLDVDIELVGRIQQTAVGCEKSARELEKILLVP